MQGIKLLSMGNTIRVGESHALIPQLLVVEPGENLHPYYTQSSDEVAYEWYQIDRHSKLKVSLLFLAVSDVKFFHSCFSTWYQL